MARPEAERQLHKQERRRGRMAQPSSKSRRCILGVFAHPDDETSGAAGTFTRYAREGVDVYVTTATRGEQGTLGTGDLKIDRRDLPAVRETELRSALEMFGIRPPILLGYRDQELVDADFDELVERVEAVMARHQPDLVITFGPRGISNHPDHITIHRASVKAFDRYRAHAGRKPRLFYVAIPEEAAKRFDLDLDGPETTPTVIIDISRDKAVKVRALRTYKSQEDAQHLADMFETEPFDIEGFHQAYPPVPDGRVDGGFWT
jgi:LmbE family N-acetylglucosaminyl deacetylase